MQLYTRDYTSGRNTICTQYLYSLYLFLLVVLFSVQIKAISSKWWQIEYPIELAGQSMSLLSFPKQRRLSSHIGVNDEASEKLYRSNDHANTNAPAI